MDQKLLQAKLSELSSMVYYCDCELFNHLEKEDSSNFFFCFRWLLINFKREFRYATAVLAFVTLLFIYLFNFFFNPLIFNVLLGILSHGALSYLLSHYTHLPFYKIRMNRKTVSCNHLLNYQLLYDLII